MNRNYKKDISGKINFDYSKNNGLFFIGENEYLFGIKVSKGSKTSIHFYNDDPSIKGIALIKDIFNLDNVDFLKDYDMSSRSQSPEIGDSIVLKNKYNKLAALKIMDIKDNTRGDDKDNLEIEYKIFVEKNIKYLIYIIKNFLKKMVASLWFLILYPIIISLIGAVIYDMFIKSLF
jgi:hypothetical protein